MLVATGIPQGIKLVLVAAILLLTTVLNAPVKIRLGHLQQLQQQLEHQCPTKATGFPSATVSTEPPKTTPGGQTGVQKHPQIQITGSPTLKTRIISQNNGK